MAVTFVGSVDKGYVSPPAFVGARPSVVGESKVSMTAHRAIRTVGSAASKLPTLGKRVASLISEVKARVGVTSSLVSIARHITTIATKTFKPAVFVAKAIKVAKLCAFISLPFTAFSIVKSGLHFAKAGLDGKIDSGLAVVSGFGDLGDGIATGVGGLMDLGIVAEEVMMWVSPLALVSVAFSLASVVANAKGWWESHRILQDFLDRTGLDRTKDYTEEDYERVMEFIQNQEDRDLKKHFGVKGNVLQEGLTSVWERTAHMLESANEEDVEKAHLERNRAINALKGRVQAKITSHKLAIVARVAAAVALIFLVFCPVLAPIGSALVVVAAAVSVGSFFYNRKAAKHFKHSLDL